MTIMTGRKSKYETHVKPKIDLIKKSYCRDGLTDVEYIRDSVLLYQDSIIQKYISGKIKPCHLIIIQR